MRDGMQYGGLRLAEFALFEHPFSPLGELLSVACPTESNQRGGHPAITALRLPCVAQQSKRSRNSTWQLTNNVSCCGIQTVAPFSLTLSPLLSVMGWGLSRQTHSVEVLTFQITHSVIQFAPRGTHGFLGPYLTRRVAQSAWEYSASGCPSSAVACVLCKPLGRVSLDAHADEQRRNQAEARVHFFWLLILWASKEK